MSRPTTPALPASGPPSHGLVGDVRRLLGAARHGWPIVVVAVLSCLTAAAIYLARKTTVYEATSRLLVLQEGGNPLSLGHGEPSRGAERPGEYLPTQALILRSPLVVGRALESLNRPDISVREITEKLSVTRPDQGASVLQIGYVADDPEEANSLVGAILASYERFLEERYHKINRDVSQFLTKARDELSQELQSLEQRYLELLQEAPAEASAEEGRASQARRVEQWDRAAREAQVRAVHLRAQLELGQKLANEGASLWAIMQSMGQLGGSLEPPRQSDVKSDTASRARIIEELTELELRRISAERLLQELNDRANSPEALELVDEAELARMFADDPDVVAIRTQLSTMMERLAMAQRASRNPDDPAIRMGSRRIRDLQDELALLWEVRRPELLERLQRDLHSETEAGRARVEIAMVRAREETLREKLAELDASLLERLERREQELIEQFGPQHEKVATLQGEIAQLRDSDPKVAGQPDLGAIHDLLGAVERSLSAVESLREDLQEEFSEGLTASKQAEVDRLAIDNVRSNLDRQRTLFNAVVDQLKQVQLTSDFNGITAQVIDPPNTEPIRPNIVLVLAVALTFGLILGLGITAVADQMDPRLHSIDEIRQAAGLNILGLIPRLPKDHLTNPSGAGLLGHSLPRSPLAEGFRIVRASLDLRNRNQPRQVILVTSPRAGDGKSTTASNLAISLAQAGRRVLLIDADLRRPTLNTVHDVPRDVGLSQTLQERKPIDRVVQPTAVKNLDLITAGPEVHAPAELLSTPQFSDLIEEARQNYETVIIDSPPLLNVADTTILGGLADGIVLVLRSTTVRLHEVTRSMELLEAIGTTTLGTVINDAVNRRGSSYGYGYGYGTYGLPGLPNHGASGSDAGRDGVESLTSPPDDRNQDRPDSPGPDRHRGHQRP